MASFKSRVDDLTDLAEKGDVPVERLALWLDIERERFGPGPELEDIIRYALRYRKISDQKIRETIQKLLIPNSPSPVSLLSPHQ